VTWYSYSGLIQRPYHRGNSLVTQHLRASYNYVVKEAPAIIGLVGQPLAGKDTVAAILVDHGYIHVSTGDLIRAYISEHKLGELTRPVQQDTANMMRAQHGGDYWVAHALQNRPDKLVISGIRTVAEAERVKSEGGVLVWVDASQRLRFERLAGRNRPGDALTFEQFAAQEARENQNDDPAQQSVATLEGMADRRVVNNGEPATLRKAVEREVLGQ
jgi:dephospho-CoA kinase